jgi:hypothetical protein
MCGLLHQLVENTHFLLHVHRKRSSNLGRRKFSSIAQYRSEVTDTGTSSSSKKVRTPHTKLKNGTPHSNPGAVEWPSKFPRVLWDQYRKCCLLTAKGTLRHLGERHFEWTARQQKRGTPLT